MATDQVIPGNGAAVVVNANFEAARAAMMYGRRASTTGTPTALTWGYYGGEFGPGVTVADGTITLTNSATNYIVAARSNGAVSSATNTTNWLDSANYIQLYEVVAAGGVVTSYTDRRPSVYNSAGGGGGSGTVTSVAVAGGVGLDSSGGPVTSSGTITIDLDAAAQASLALADSSMQPGDLVPAADVTIVDAGGYFTSTDVEGALQELGAGGGGGGMVNPMTTAGDIIYGGASGAPTRLAGGSNKQVLAYDTGSSTPGWVTLPLQTLAIAASDLVTNISTGTGKAYFYAPYDFAVAEVQASLDTPQSAGSIFTVDVNKNGTTILSTKVTIDNTEGSSITAATPPVISTALLTKGDKITVDVDQIGTAGAKGLIVYLVGRPN